MSQYTSVRFAQAAHALRLRARSWVGPIEGVSANLWSDLVQTWRMRDLCAALAFQKSIAQHRGSLLGPVWIALSFAIFALGVGVIWSALFDEPFQSFLPYVTLGLLVWTFMMGVIADGARSLRDNRAMLLQSRTPAVLYPLAAVIKHLIIAAHNLPFVLGVLLVFATPSTEWMLAAAGVVMLVCIGAGVAISLSVVCAYLPDLAEIIAAGLRFAFFFTPILWYPSTREWMRPIWMGNPFYHCVEIVRGPMLGHEGVLFSFYVGGALVVLSIGVAAITYWRASGAVRTRL
jgi:ABC-type polysaccharide/polyol phosphate export permease